MSQKGAAASGKGRETGREGRVVWKRTAFLCSPVLALSPPRPRELLFTRVGIGWHRLIMAVTANTGSQRSRDWGWKWATSQGPRAAA